MPKAPARLAVAATLAALAAAVQAFSMNLVPLLDATSLLDLSLLQLLFPALTVVDVVLSPVLVGVAGYAWGAKADVRDGYPRFGAVVAGTALLAFVVTFLATLTPSIATGSVSNLVLRAVSGAALALGALSIPAAGLVGAAVGHFRTTDRRDADPAAVPDRDPAVDRRDRDASPGSRREERERTPATE